MKTKHLFFGFLFLTVYILTGFCFGYYMGAKEDLFFKNGVIYTERNIAIMGYRSVDGITQIFQHIEVEGTSVNGAITSISVSDVSEICTIIKSIKDVDPILSIKVIDSDHVEVQTGVVRGPLNGGGSYYDLEKIQGKWRLIENGLIKSWVS